MNEIWKEIKGFENYQVSNLGRVKRFDKKITDKSGNISIVPNLIKLYKDKNGYIICYLYNNGNKKLLFVHRLVAIAFIPNDNPRVKTIVNHKNEIKDCNIVDNLEWCDYKYNNNYGTKIERTEITKMKNNTHFNRAVNQLDLSGNIINTWKSVRDAARIINDDFNECVSGLERGIRKVCAGKQRTCRGFKWEYVK